MLPDRRSPNNDDDCSEVPTEKKRRMSGVTSSSLWKRLATQKRDCWRRRRRRREKESMARKASPQRLGREKRTFFFRGNDRSGIFCIENEKKPFFRIWWRREKATFSP